MWLTVNLKIKTLHFSRIEVVRDFNKMRKWKTPLKTGIKKSKFNTVDK